MTSLKEEKVDASAQAQAKEIKLKVIKEIRPKLKPVDSDLELGLNVINEENRGLTTDMLGLPAVFNKTPTDILISNLNTNEMSKIILKEELLEKRLLESRGSKVIDYKAVIDAIDDLLKIWLVKRIDFFYLEFRFINLKLIFQ